MTRLVIVLTSLAPLLFASPTPAADELAAGFASPPDSAKPWAYWWWLDSYATPEGITRDLEEMKRQGISGVLLFDAGEGGPDAPKGPVFMSPAWRELYKHALREADRLGIEVGVNICSGWNAGGTWVTPEHAAKELTWSAADIQGPGTVTRELPKPKTFSDYYHDIAVLAFPAGGRPANAVGLKHWQHKAAKVFLAVVPDALDEEDAGTPGERDYEARQVIDLTKQTNEAGQLTWDVPNGSWTVLRFGYTLLDCKTKCVSPGSQGYEVDFFSAAALDQHWAHTGEVMAADARAIGAKSLKYIHDDSYEVFGPNWAQATWTPAFLTEFRTRRGYDPVPCLPTLTGRIIDSREVTNRFLRDYRRTIADLLAAGHYKRLHELAHKCGLGTHPESGGPYWPCMDALEVLAFNDIPMGEFWKRAPEPDGKITWSNDYHICDTVRQAACAAHIYGKPVCQAEAYTSMGPNWEEDFFDLKDIGDQAFCAGLTRNVLCFYVHQGKLDAKPGYEWEAAGTHFDRNVTWWDQIDAWALYLGRCQYMLQQGLFAADLCYYYGEDAPNYVPAKTHMRPALPKGYDCDTINTDVLYNRIGAKNGRLVLPDGMNYRLLVLPQRQTLSPQVLRRLQQLILAGATVLGPRPTHAPGLSDYPQCDAEVKALAANLWGAATDAPTGEHRIGEGRIIWGRTPGEVLAAAGVPPDFEYRAPSDAKIDFIHRTGKVGELYFVSNQLNRPEKAECIFRVAGRQPELWDAVTGERWDAGNYRIDEDRTTVPLEFAPRQSLFVVFRRPAAQPAATGANFPTLISAGSLSGPWTVRFDPKWGGPESVQFEQLTDWTKHAEPGIKYYSGKAIYQKSFDLPQAAQVKDGRVWLDLGKVENVAEVRLNGKDLGVVWTAPWRVEITAAMQPKDNKLEIDVVNLWPNRLIGDAALPAEKRLTVTNVKKFKKDSPLLESGLLGPVSIQVSQR